MQLPAQQPIESRHFRHGPRLGRHRYEQRLFGALDAKPGILQPNVRALVFVNDRLTVARMDVARLEHCLMRRTQQCGDLAFGAAFQNVEAKKRQGGSPVEINARFIRGEMF